jgi:hypothetical protein
MALKVWVEGRNRFGPQTRPNMGIMEFEATERGLSPTKINGNSRILKWRYVSTICLAIFWGYIPLHRPYIGLIYGRYLQFRFLKWPLKKYGSKCIQMDLTNQIYIV